MKSEQLLACLWLWRGWVDLDLSVWWWTRRFFFTDDTHPIVVSCFLPCFDYFLPSIFPLICMWWSRKWSKTERQQLQGKRESTICAKQTTCQAVSTLASLSLCSCVLIQRSQWAKLLSHRSIISLSSNTNTIVSIHLVRHYLPATCLKYRNLAKIPFYRPQLTSAIYL